MSRSLFLALLELKKSRKLFIRGTLTNGYEWWFLLLTIDSLNGNGASYRMSARPLSPAPIEGPINLEVDAQACNKISGILASWVCR